MLSFPFRGAPALDYQRHSTGRFHWMWGTVTAMWGAITFPVGHDSGHVGHDSVDSRMLPHIPAESRPASQRNPAPLQTESLPHLNRNTQYEPGLLALQFIRWRNQIQSLDSI